MTEIIRRLLCKIPRREPKAFRWTNTTNNNRWFDRRNWEPSGVPRAHDNIVFALDSDIADLHGTDIPYPLGRTIILRLAKDYVDD